MLVVIIISYYFFLVVNSEKFARDLFAGISESNAKHNSIVLFQRIASLIILGSSALICDALQHFRILKSLVDSTTFHSSILWIASLGSLLILVSIIFTILKNSNNQFPQLYFSSWGIKQFIINSGSWAAYLFFYEMMLRGIFLNELLSYVNIPIAIAANTLLYVLLHKNKNKIEIIACIPFGILVCAATISSGSFLAAFVVHFLFSSGIEYSSLFNRNHSQNNLIKS